MNQTLEQTASTRTAFPVANVGGPADSRLRVAGKFLFSGCEKLYVRGVAYGPFRPEDDGSEYHKPGAVQRDFVQMRQHGINAVRTYTVPPHWFLDLASQHGLRVLVGLPWEQHVTFLADRGRARDIEQRIRAGVRQCANHPAILGYTVGNEIPAPIVRWYGHRRVERFLERLYWAAKSVDPDGLVSYVNYPSTEYLELPFLDFFAFNVYLESQERLHSYLARLQNMSGDRPVILAELGLDSLRNGDGTQARVLDWQTHVSFFSGCAGLFVFSWTDEWYRGGGDISDWKFGLTTIAREPKPALHTVGQAFQEVPFPRQTSWPLISVIVCTYNGSRTLRDCLGGLERLNYPAFEVIVVDDGSKDDTAAIAAEYPVRLIRIANGGLSNARNVGWQAAKGEIVAFLDDDAAPDPDWLFYLAGTFLATNCAGVGGPNLAWPNDGFVAQCVDHSPGNPTHVLLTDCEAEHLPGCNMAFRKSCLAEVGGFDAQFRIAGDDVDLCWRLQQRGMRLGFHPAAMVWHHRRGNIRDYWKQQVNYGKAEAMLERKWPEKYNAVGHATWNGRLYSKGFLSLFTWSQRRIYHGTWGTALFQSVYSRTPGTFASILMLPEWYLVISLLALISACSFLYPPLRFARIALGVAFVPPLTNAFITGARACFRIVPRSWWRRLGMATMTAVLHFLQPAARLWGRLCQGLTPWRSRGGDGSLVVPWPRTINVWSDKGWFSAEQRLTASEDALRAAGAAVARGGEYDRWDLEVRGGLLGSARLLMAIEEHGTGRQYIRMRMWPTARPTIFLVASLFAALAIRAALDLEWNAWALLNIPAIFLVARALYESASAMAALRQASTAGNRPLAQTHSEPRG
jgi:glycosyltransferase involved in cell wall biosynthesis